MICDHNHVLLVLQFGTIRSIALTNTFTIELSLCKTNSLQGRPDGGQRYAIFAVFDAIFDISIFSCDFRYIQYFCNNIKYLNKTKITGDIDILRDFIYNIRYLTPPPRPPCWNNGDDPNKFLQIFPNSNFQPQKKIRAKNNVKINPTFELYRFTLLLIVQGIYKL